MPSNRTRAGVFQLKQVLDGPGSAFIRGIILFPTEGLKEMIVANLDIGGNDILNLGISAAKENILARPFQIIIDDFKGAGAVPPANGLSFKARR